MTLNREDISLYLTTAIAFFIPLSRLMVSVFLIALLVKSIYDIAKKKVVCRNYKYLIILISLYAVYALGLLYTENLKSGLSHLETKLSLILVPVVVSLSFLNRTNSKLIQHYFSAGVILGSLICLSVATYNYFFEHHVYHQNEFFFFYQDLASPLHIHSAYLSLFVSFTIFILLNKFIKDFGVINRQQKLIYLFGAIYLVGFNFLLASRMPLMVFIIMLIILLVSKLKKNKKLMIAMSIMLLAGIVLLLKTDNFATERFSRFNSLGYDIENPDFKAWNGITTRMAIWSCTWEIAKNNIVLGVGRGDSRDELMKAFKSRNFHYAYNEGYNVHNQYLQTFLSSGVVGLLALLSCIGLPLYSSIKNKNTTGILFSILIILVFMTESYLARFHGVVFFSMFNSIFAFD